MPVDDPGDEPFGGPPPDPLDRTWVHPSELRGAPSPRRAAPAPPAPRGRSRAWASALVGGLVGALAMAGILGALGLLGDDSPAPSASAPTRDSTPAAAAELAAQAGRSVVAVLASTPMGVVRASGLCVGGGRVLTDATAIEAATALTIVAADGRRTTATRKGSDPETGLALLTVASDAADAAPLAADADLRPGSWVMAVAAADAMRPWVATGAVATLGGWTQIGDTARVGLIETDAAVPASAAGGALVDRDGHVVGVLTAPADGRGVAVPAAMARVVADQLGTTGRVRHGWLGLETEDAAPVGVRVRAVSEGGPSAGRGIAVGDVVESVDGRRVEDAAALVYAVRLRTPGTPVELGLRRDGRSRTVRVPLGELPTTAPGGATPVAALTGTG